VCPASSGRTPHKTEKNAMSTKKVMKILRSRGLQGIAEPCLKFRTLPTTKKKLALGSSKLGGDPDLPIGIPWPTNNGRPLDFLLQLNLSKLPRKLVEDALPERGWIYFFYDIDNNPWGFDVSDRLGWRVLFYDGNLTNLQRRERPDSIEARLRPCKLSFFEVIYVNWPSLQDEKSIADLHYLNEHEGLFDAQVEISGHQILGNFHGCQNSYEEMQRECQLASNGIYWGGGGAPIFDHVKAEQFKPGIKDWRFLLELGADDNANLDLTDYGTLYFWIREDDLRNCDFHNVWAIFQCT
jgi:uncharacterized protein YwqG